MSGGQRIVARVELSYTPTVEDFREALSARAKVSVSFRRTRLLMAFVALCMVSVVVLSWAGDDYGDLLPAVMGLVFLLVLLGQTRMQAKSLHRLAAAKGEQRIVADETGVTVATQQGTTSLTWQAAPRYVETPGLFVLLSGDKNASGLTLLPKRGASGPVDADRLRALLDQRLSRVGTAHPRPGRVPSQD
ncbi:YcxB family protein [Streptomyces sp. NPDC054786]